MNIQELILKSSEQVLAQEVMVVQDKVNTYKIVKLELIIICKVCIKKLQEE
jgi:hypothetical protein